MAILPYDLTTGTTVDPSKIQGNDEALEAVLSGGITQLNMDSSTRIPNSYLANNDFIFTVDLVFQGNDSDASDDSWLNVSGTAVATAGLPYDATEGNTTYTIIGVDFIYRNAGATQPAFTVEWGYSNAGTWSTGAGGGGTGATIVSSTTLAASALLIGPAAMAINTSTITTNSLQPRCFAIKVNNATTGFDAAGDFLNVTLKLKRELRS